jgi:hypothetical protein
MHRPKHDAARLKAVSEAFDIPGAFIHAEPYGTGHINDTYATRWRVNGAEKAFILQRINHNVFRQPPLVMDNIGRVSAHLRAKLAAQPGSDPDRETLTVIPSRAGAMYHQDDQGDYWRTYVFIASARTVDVCERPAQAYEAAKAFGRFQGLLTDLPGPRLHDTIPFFHHTPRRFAALEQAIAEDPKGRAAGAQPEIAFALARRGLTSRVTDAMASGEIPERITHNDTKVNNVMLDCATDRGVCVIDLDTIMPGTVLYDFGDMVRTMTRSCAEDERDPSRVGCAPAMFEAVARGYLESARGFLLPAEVDLLVFAGILVTFNIGIRFLTDYLLGDTYFKTHRPDQNLDRARVQFRMIESLERQEQALGDLVNRYRERDRP